MSLAGMDLTEGQFRRICGLVHAASGIRLKKGKEALVRARLAKRLRASGIGDIDAYLSLVESGAGAGELDSFVDVMTTNKTGFFREIAHFHFLSDTVLPGLAEQRLRFWCAACSSGEEPYSLAMLLLEKLPHIGRRDVRILATDISRRMLAKARRARYPRQALQGAAAAGYGKYFVNLRGGREQQFQVVPEARRLVRTAWLNLQRPWPMRGPFNLVFCRNVMIYFDRPTRQGLVDRLWDIIAPGGYLFVGHAEGLSGVEHRFEYVKPAIYRK